MMSIKSIMERIKHQPAERKVFVSIPLDRDGRGEDEESAIRSNEHYFEIRITEMFLKDRAKFLKKYTPMVLAVTECQYGSERRVVPFIAANQTLKGVGHFVEKESVDQHWIRLVGPVPYVGDDVSLFVGLFAVATNDLASELLGVIEGVAMAGSMIGMSAYLQIAEPLYNGLQRLLGLKAMKLRVGRLEIFSDSGGDTNPFRATHLAYVNRVEDNDFISGLAVDNGRLVHPAGMGNIQFLTDHDFCLVKIVKNDRRNDYSSLPFHRHWEEAQQSVWEGNENAADGAFIRLAKELATSPDLTRKHRFQLQSLYKFNLEEEVAAYRAAAPTFRGRSQSTHRGSDDKLSATMVLRAAAHRMKQAGIPEDIYSTLLAAADHWGRFFPATERRTRDFTLTADVINQQLTELDRLGPVSPWRPKAMAEALTMTVLAS